MKRKATPPKRRGGIRQRLQRQREAEETKSSHSHLLLLLVHLFAWGEISAQLCQRIAEAAYKDALAMSADESTLEDLNRIGQIGSSGKYSNKCFSEFMARIPFTTRVPKPGVAKLPFKQPLKSLTQSFLWPHELFAAIYQGYPTSFCKCIVPSKERLKAFWSKNVSHPAMANSDLLSRPHFEEWCVPLAIHGDDVPVTGIGKGWAALMTIYSWTSMIGYGDTKTSQFFIYGVFDKLRAISPDQTLDTNGCFFKMLVWSLQWLYRGQWPDRDWNGKAQLVFLAGVCVNP